MKEKIERGPRAIFSRNRRKTFTQQKFARVIDELKFRDNFGDIQARRKRGVWGTRHPLDLSNGRQNPGKDSVSRQIANKC